MWITKSPQHRGPSSLLLVELVVTIDHPPANFHGHVVVERAFSPLQIIERVRAGGTEWLIADPAVDDLRTLPSRLSTTGDTVQSHNAPYFKGKEKRNH
jgi:hypothetical protein